MSAPFLNRVITLLFYCPKSEDEKEQMVFTFRLRQAGHACRACLRQVPGRSGVVWMNLTIVGWGWTMSVGWTMESTASESPLDVAEGLANYGRWRAAVS